MGVLCYRRTVDLLRFKKFARCAQNFLTSESWQQTKFLLLRVKKENITPFEIEARFGGPKDQVEGMRAPSNEPPISHSTCCYEIAIGLLAKDLYVSNIGT